MKIGIDMDGVIVDTTPSLIKQANIACRTKLTMEDIVEPSMAEIAWKHTTDKRKKQMGVEHPRDLYSWLCPPDFFLNLDPAEGAIETVKKIAEEHEIIIITKPIEWSCCSYEKNEWLKQHLVGIPYQIIMTSSMATKGIVGVDVIVDDDIRVIQASELAVPILVKQPWNELFLKDIYAKTVDSIIDVPAAIKEIQDQELFE